MARVLFINGGSEGHINISLYHTNSIEFSGNIDKLLTGIA